MKRKNKFCWTLSPQMHDRNPLSATYSTKKLGWALIGAWAVIGMNKVDSCQRVL